MRAVVYSLFVLGLLWDSVRAENTIGGLKVAAAAWAGELPCRKWDCECTFKRQRSCCCANQELQEAEDQIFVRMMDLSLRVSQLGDSVLEVIGTLEHDQ
ncbi:hypothetical protein F2P81_010484 [Scophthalmus maximus]|uniref:Uncharacterized protein n=1 Tax=Scophthalmus maximus TaxID=52904 RepID=A0A6A4T0R7_SCOMX|nr:hypothetical protein F2P81_010484 [Scophthalmus maximus]